MVNSQNKTWSEAAFGGLQTIYSDIKAAAKTASVRRTKYRETYAELIALSDRDLNDIGIARYDIARLATEESEKAVQAAR
jgi:uncharacterized protein YjiS (DUF1127 family)